MLASILILVLLLESEIDHSPEHGIQSGLVDRWDAVRVEGVKAVSPPFQFFITLLSPSISKV